MGYIIVRVQSGEMPPYIVQSIATYLLVDAAYHMRHALPEEDGPFPSLYSISKYQVHPFGISSHLAGIKPAR